MVNSSAGRIQLGFYRLNKSGATDVKRDVSVLNENSSFKMLRLLFSSELDWGSYIIFADKTFFGTLIRSLKLFSSQIVLYLQKSMIGHRM